MHLLGLLVLLVALLAAVSFAAPADHKDSPKEAKSAFGQPFDEIVVESSLTVKRKTGARQSRNQDVQGGASLNLRRQKRHTEWGF